MALTLVATPGATTANTYCTRVEADTYHESVIAAHRTDWTNATSTTKDEALAMATRLLDAMYEWAEFPAETTQALQWPRRGVLDHLRLSYIAEDAIPAQLRDATAEFARQLIAANRALDSEVETNGVTSIRAGSVSLTFKDAVYPKVVPDAVAAMLPSWWGYVRSRNRGVRELVRA